MISKLFQAATEISEPDSSAIKGIIDVITSLVTDIDYCPDTSLISLNKPTSRHR